MMRYTKAQILRDMETAREFHKVPFRVVRDLAAANKMRGLGGFVPACQYGRGMSLVMVAGELGCTDGTRFKADTRKAK